MSRLDRYVEWMTRCRRTGRIAYVTSPEAVPDPMPGAEWRRDRLFNVSEALFNDPDPKGVISAALANRIQIDVPTKSPAAKLRLDRSPDLPDDTPIGDVKFPSRIRNALITAEIATVAEVRDTSDRLFLTFQNLGGRSVAHLLTTLGPSRAEGASR
jgi:Bacterial RNA polymerase, alpha chain C terminal domain